MSERQLAIYASARQVEIKQERQSKKKAKKDKILGELYSDTTSTYRIFSRAFVILFFRKVYIDLYLKKHG